MQIKSDRERREEWEYYGEIEFIMSTTFFGVQYVKYDISQLSGFGPIGTLMTD